MMSDGEGVVKSGTAPAANVDGRFRVSVSPKCDQVCLDRLVPHSGQGRPVTVGQVMQKLKKLKVICGIDTARLQQIADDLAQGIVPDRKVVIAEAEKPVDGVDARWHWDVDVERGADSGIVQVVTVNQRIVTCIPATPGEPGRDVMGRTLRPRPGRERTIWCGDAVVRMSQGGTVEYRAGEFGVVQWDGETLAVMPLLSVSADGMAVTMPVTALPWIHHADVDAAAVLAGLEGLGVRHGIQREMIERLVQGLSAGEVETPPADDGQVVVARGDEPVAGDAARLRWVVEIAGMPESRRVVLPGDLLVFYIPPAPGRPGRNVWGHDIAPPDPEDDSVTAGEGVTAENVLGGTEFRATRFGVVSLSEQRVLSVAVRVDVSQDKMAATMDIYGRTCGEKPVDVTVEHIVKACIDRGVCFGFCRDAIAEALEVARRSHQCAPAVVVARGRSPQHGAAARVELDERVTAGRLLEDGRIDFRDRSYPWNVKAGAVVGQFVPPREAVDGTNVLGEPLPARAAEHSDITLTGLVQSGDETLAAADGVLTVTGNAVTVSDMAVVDGDVGPQSGHVKAETAVHVKGFVNPGYLVASKADVIINGNLEDAVVYAGGNVVIRGGVRGRRAKIYADGRVSVGFVEGGAIYARSDIEVTRSVIDAVLEACGDIRVGPSPGAIIHSECLSLGQIWAVQIGRPASEASKIRLAFPADKRRRLADLEDRETLTVYEKLEKRWLTHYREAAETARPAHALRVLKKINSDVVLTIGTKVLKIQAEAASRDYFLDPETRGIVFRAYDAGMPIPEVRSEVSSAADAQAGEPVGDGLPE